MNDQTPIEKAGGHDTAFDYGIGSYYRKYLEYCLSQKPRTEMLFGFVVFSLTIGILSSVVPRIMSYSVEVVWLTLTFFGYLAYHLHDSYWCTHLIIDEAIVRAFRARGYRTRPFFEETSIIRFWARSILCLLFTTAALLCILFAVLFAFDTFAPILILRRVPYSGGG